MGQLSLFLASFIFVVSPIWPLGENPLPGDPYVIVNKSNNTFAYLHDGEIEKVGRVATGKSKELTPEGVFTIIVKAVDPYYRKMDIPGGDPDNPLGSRWIGFDAKDTDGRTYGLHGTNTPKAIGRFITAGCVRFYEDDIRWLYDHVPLGTKVLIVDTNKSFEEVASDQGVLH
ncbi:L,D-transpeptidase [Pseudalkalibacillus salsuginis]|uniref:L,D-transpeptidase n=1 Tax=Pseudalkalibacillus salsuginis TaxID=2910972 RepID=UPI001F3360B9|nr:L,D-transpeptidase [Pseudalkalibacillus salsuginis]MCF6408371.1 L,D-transpeptidase [Pseudalkalibacillus salsuginis]